MSEPVSTPSGFEDLPVEEQIDYVHRLWDRIRSRPEDVPAPDWHLAELERRMADPKSLEGASSWETVRERILRSERPDPGE